MKYVIHILLVTLFLSSLHLNNFAQSAKSFDILKDDVETVLPPLNSLIDSAISHNPYVKYRENQVLINKANLNTNQTQWTRNIGIQGDVRYGTFNNFYTDTQGGQTPNINSSINSELNYGVGAFIRIPIDEVFNRKHQVKTAKMQLEQAHNMAEVQKDELKQTVIKQYNDLILKHRLLKIKSRYLEISRNNIETAEKDFRSGAILVSDYTRMSELATNSEADFQTIKVEFNTAYLILEEITGMKFNLYKQ